MTFSFLIRIAAAGILAAVLFTLYGCKPQTPKPKAPSDRKIILNMCWQTFELGMKDKNAFVQNHTMRLLGRIGNRRAVIALQSADFKGKPTLVRVYVNTLSKIKDTLAFQSLYDNFKTSDFQIRAKAVTGLAGMGSLYDDSTVIRMLKKAFRDVDSIVVDSLLYDSVTTAGEKSELRAKIGIALLKYKQKDGLTYIQKGIKDASFQARLSVVNTLGEVQPEESVDMLSRFKKDPSEFVRAKTAEALGKIGNPPAIDLLNEFMTKDPSESVRISAAIELLKTDEASAYPVIMQGLQSYDDDIRSKSILALGDVKNKDAKDKISKIISPLIEDPNEWIRISVIGALGKMMDTSSAVIIEKALDSDPSQDVREIALSVLARFRGKDMTGKLLSYLREDSYSMRSAAVSALGRIKDGKLVDQTIIPEIFDRMVNDPDMIVRVWAAFVLYDILNDYRITSADNLKS